MKKENDNPNCVEIYHIEYRVSRSKNLYEFFEVNGFFGKDTILVFKKERRLKGWQVCLDRTCGNVMIKHLTRAYEIIQEEQKNES